MPRTKDRRYVLIKARDLAREQRKYEYTFVPRYDGDTMLALGDNVAVDTLLSYALEPLVPLLLVLLDPHARRVVWAVSAKMILQTVGDGDIAYS